MEIKEPKLQRHLPLWIAMLIAVSLCALAGRAQQSQPTAGGPAAQNVSGLTPAGVTASSEPSSSNNGVEVSPAVKHDVSPPLRTIPPIVNFGAPAQKQVKFLGLIHPNSPLSTSPDGAVQSSAGQLVGTMAGINILGVGEGFTGPGGAFTVNSAPSDSNGAVGATQFVEWVNESFAVFDKTTGTVVYGPAAGNTLWSGFGGGCEANNDGDPIAQYDKAANRWVLSQFSVSTTPFLQCVAVSTTSDATGAYYRYSFQVANFPDYPKQGAWPDAYYFSFNMFKGNTFVGARACAFDRRNMLIGNAATQQCFQLSSSFGGLLPSDLDGATPPPTGSPNYFLNFGTNSLNLWKFHVDWVTPGNSTFTGPITISVAAFSEACTGGACIPQMGTRETLDSLGDRLMYRLAYRNLGDHDSLVVNHSVSVGSSVGVRWYELRNPGGAPSVYQQGTYSPDSNFRWMGSIAMDSAGDIALGYSVSSSAMFPAIHYTGRVPVDPLGTLEAEKSIVEGGGSQLRNLNRWGDYTSMSIDPVDDCTFWHTNQYLQASGTFNWSTRIGSFKFPSCNPPPPTVAIDLPSQSSTVFGTVTVAGWAIDNGSAISTVQVKVDGVAVGNATYGVSRPDVCNVYPGRPGCPNVGYTYQWNTATLTSGSHTLTVLATDTDAIPDMGSASVTVTVVPVPPTVDIDLPSQGSTVFGTVTVAGWAIDNTSLVGTAISSVQVKVDGVAVGNATYGVSRPDVCNVFPGRPGCPNVGYTYQWNTATLTSGSHTLTVSATDTDAIPDMGSASVTVTVSPVPPTAYIDTPSQGSTVSGTVTVAGWAIDNGSVVGTAISSVQVKVDGVAVGNATYGVSRPDVCNVFPGRPGCPNVGYTYQLDTTKFTAGTHTITVSATDTDASPDVGSASVTVTFQ
jgi:Big-like domain-containing protein